MSTEPTQPKPDPRPAELDDAFLPWQVALLKQPVPKSLLHSRNQGGKALEYIAGHDAIDMANGVFGRGNWGYTTAQVWCVGAVYHALVTLQVHTPSGQIIERGDLGTCDIQGWKPDQQPNINAVQQAAKGSVTDGLKRCLRTFGAFFGNDLYRDDEPVHAPARPAAAPASADGTWESTASPEREPNPEQGETKACPACGAPMVFRAGVKDGKEWKAWFCGAKCGQKPQFLPTGGNR
jgi:hypothetical protein